MHSFKAKDRVTIINRTLSGQFIVEGEAVVVRPVRDVEERYVVRFDEYHETAERFVDPAAQADPVAFVAKLNAA